jgi:hypothetical protein
MESEEIHMAARENRLEKYIVKLTEPECTYLRELLTGRKPPLGMRATNGGYLGYRNHFHWCCDLRSLTATLQACSGVQVI